MITNNTSVEREVYESYEELITLFDKNNDCIYDLIEKGVSLNVYSENGNSFFFYVLKNCSDFDIIKAIIDNGADIHSRSILGRTPLIVNVKNHDTPEIVSLLLNEGSDSNAIDNYGNTALTYCEIFSRCNKTKELLRKASKSNCICFDKIMNSFQRY